MRTDKVYTKTEIVKNEFTMMLPNGFAPMQEAIAKIKYPAQARPHVILTNGNATVDYKFTYINEVIQEAALEELIRLTKMNLKRVYTGIEYHKEEIQERNNTRLGWFDYMSPAIGGMLYNISFFTWVKGRVLQGTFTCEFADIDVWRESFLESILSIEEVMENE